MRVAFDPRPQWVALLLLIAVAVAVNGCSRTKYRLQADRDAYEMIAERNCDPRWSAADYSIELDPRSRYFDPYNPDCSPMPPDDPTSHQYMQVVDGKKGWKHWYDNGTRIELENPVWRGALAEAVEIDEKGTVKLSVDSALKLAYIHSPSHQSQLETLYLSALDVTSERFRLATQFFGGYDARYAHNGSLIPPGLRYVPALGRFEVVPAIDGAGVENNRVTLGRPFSADPALLARRRFATAGDLLVGFANSFVFEFTGGDANLTTSLANFSLVQPLLRGAGRDIALEQLTFDERTLLANLRAYSQFRQGFYTQVAVGDLGVSGPQRGGRGTTLSVFIGQGATAGGYIGLLEQIQRTRNTEDNLNLQLRTLAQLEALLEVGVIDLVQVDQFRQQVETQRSGLLLNRNNLEFAIDSYKTSTLGLPPDLSIELDDSLIRQFQLVARSATAIQDSTIELQDRLGELPDDAGIEPTGQILIDASLLIEPVRRQLDDVQTDLARMEEAVPDRERSMDDEGKELFREDREQLAETLVDLNQQFNVAAAELESLQDGLSDPTRAATARRMVVWLGNFLRLVQRSILVQARARLEAVSVETIDLRPEDAFQIALANRMDFMNGRAALVDSWRQIQFNADALQSVVNITASGDLRTARNNPVSFRAPTGNLRLGLEFDAPITRLIERNTYRETLINYQRSRRAFIQSRDSLHLGLRTQLRRIELLRQNLEIQRRAVAIAIRRVDLTRAQLYAPVPPPQPGQRPASFGPTAAFNLLTAQTSLLSSQNGFMSDWLDYYAARLRLSREMGIMLLDHEGRWIDEPLPGSSRGNTLDGDGAAPELLPLPPVVPDEWIERLPPLDGMLQPVDGPETSGLNGLQLLPPTGDT